MITLALLLAALPVDQIKTTLSIPDPLPGLAAQSHGQFTPAEGVIAERVSYATQYGMRIPAILYRPQNPRGRIPALIIVNGHGGDKYSWYAFYSGVLYARAGAAVLTYDPAGEGERNPERKSGTRYHDRVEQPEVMGRRLTGLMITDIQQAVSYLAQRPEVDPARIAAAGYSMGSFVLSIAGAIEPRLGAVILAGGGNLDGENGYWDNSKPMCQGSAYKALLFLGDRPAAIYTAHAGRGPTLIVNGREDTTVAIPKVGEAHLADVRRRVATLRGAADGAFDLQWIDKAGHRPWFVTKPVAEWLLRQWKMPAFQAAESNIGEWARRENVEMDRLYSTGHREGGTMAWGDFVPGLSREQLTAIPIDTWKQSPRKYTHDGWLENTRESIAALAGKPVTRQVGGATVISLLPPGPGNPRNTEGAFLPLKDGRLLYAYTKFTGGGGDHDAGFIAGRYSTDGGLTWTPADRELVGREGMMNAMSVSLLRMRDGRIAIFYLRKNSITDCRPVVRYSSDEGERWSAPQQIIPEPGYYVLNNDRVVQLSSGRIMLPLAYHPNRPDSFQGRSDVRFWVSDDDGGSWKATRQIVECPDKQSSAGLQEPGVVELNDGRLLLFTRTRLGSQYMARSSDRGETWSEPGPSALKGPLSPASIKRIPKTGHLLAVWNDHTNAPEEVRSRGLRTPFTLAISKDDGATWQVAKTLHDDPNGWYCYTAVEFVGDRVFLGYNSGGGSLPGLSRSQIAHFPVDWLYQAN